ncbi:monovalent cation/H(+) antiporter subunit G [Dankookia sp. P2]|uniref:monovalent cation/H(+) antiporter subunit G n=1 Tax=Dankookia sp. P2 TaxID=3423955 RepID=UPI003D6758CD
MAEALVLAGLVILAAVAVGLWRVLRGPDPADRLMAAQLLATGGIAVLLLLGGATPASGVARCRAGAGAARRLRLGRLRAGRTAGRLAMSAALPLLGLLAIAAGACFFVAGTAGLIRFPDVPSRLHALTKADNLGLGLVVLGLLPFAPGWLFGLKLLLVWALVLLSGATTAQLIAEQVRRPEPPA